MNGKEYKTLEASHKGRASLDSLCHLEAFFLSFQKDEDRGRNRYFLFILGKSASGKNYTLDAIVRWAKKRFPDVPLNFLVSDTTRPKREKETDGKDYKFISFMEFSRNICQDQYLEWQIFNGWRYGTRKDSVRKDAVNIAIVTPSGAKDMLVAGPLSFDRDNVFLIGVEAPLSTRLKRMKERDGISKEMFRRLRADHRDFDPESLTGYFNYQVAYPIWSQYVDILFLSGQN